MQKSQRTKYLYDKTKAKENPRPDAVKGEPLKLHLVDLLPILTAIYPETHGKIADELFFF